MTIASEITRLQNDKAAMCAAIENKGVTVGNVTLDDYAACIDAIQGGWAFLWFCYFLVWGGASGAKIINANGGGGAWEVVCGLNFSPENICVHLWTWGASVSGSCWNNGGCSYLCFDNRSIVARWGCRTTTATSGGNSGSWKAGGTGSNCGAGWGGWQCTNGTTNSGYYAGAGWCGVTYCWMQFAWGGGWGTCCGSSYRWPWRCGGWAGGYNGGAAEAATTCWSGGWGWGKGTSPSWAGAWGVAIISYPEDWKRGSATGGDCCFVCNWYCFHMFTSNWTLTIS